MKPMDDDLNGSVRGQLESLRPTSPRDPHKAAKTRANYIAQVKTLAPRVNPLPAVSGMLLGRLNGWMTQMFGPLIRKERYAMVQIMTAFVVIVAMLFGGAGATVYAAQDSLPTDALYPVKTVSEDMLLVLVNDPQSRLDLVLDLTNRRVEEIVAIVAGGEAIPDEVINRLQSELDMTLEIAAGLEDPELTEALTKIHIYIRDQDRLMGMTHAPEDSDAVFARLRANIRARNQVVVEALETPLKFSNKFQNQLQNNRPVMTDTLPITTTETISDTQGIMMEGQGPGPAAGPGPGEPLGPQAGPGPDQGAGPQAGPGSEGETGSQAGPGPSEGADSQPGPGPYGPVVTQEPVKPSTEPSKDGSGNGGK